MHKILMFFFSLTLCISLVDDTFCCIDDIKAHQESTHHDEANDTDSTTISQNSHDTQNQQDQHCEMNCTCAHLYTVTVLPLNYKIDLGSLTKTAYQFIYDQPFIGFELLPPIQA